MNLQQFEELHKEKPSQPVGVTIHAEDFTGVRSNRTLLWGYDTDRNSFHVYLEDGMVHLLRYQGSRKPGSQFEVLEFAYSFDSLDQLVPNKRLYPEACDLDFCKYLRQHGVNLPFTTFNKDREDKVFHGETL